MESDAQLYVLLGIGRSRPDVLEGKPSVLATRDGSNSKEEANRRGKCAWEKNRDDEFRFSVIGKNEWMVVAL